MSKILILDGTGYTGKLIAQHLLEHSTAEVTIATQHLDKAQALSEELKLSFSERA